MFLKADSYVINDRFALKIVTKKRVSRCFSNFLFDFGKIDLPTSNIYFSQHIKISLFKSLILNNKHKNMLLEAGSNANIECKLKLNIQLFLIRNLS